MSSLDQRIVLPAESSTTAMRSMAVALAGDGPFTLASPSGDQLDLPAEIVEVLRRAVSALVEGQAVSVMLQDTNLTTQDAAEFLGISRPTVIKLLEEGAFPYTKPGRHRRIALAGLVKYQQSLQASRREVLDAMVRDAAEQDGYAQVNGFMRTR